MRVCITERVSVIVCTVFMYACAFVCVCLCVHAARARTLSRHSRNPLFGIPAVRNTMRYLGSSISFAEIIAT